MRQLIVLLFLVLALIGCQMQSVVSNEVSILQAKAEAGDPEAQFRLANLYDSGQGLPRSGSKAKKWYEKAARQGHAESQNSMGSIYQAEEQYDKALFWYRQAADQGNALAINNLAYLYDLGLGVPQNRQKAHELYMKSASFGWAEAMFNLANMYGAGQLGETDNYKAYIWCFRSHKYAIPGWRDLQRLSSECLDYLAKELTSEQIAAARKEAEDWAPDTKDN